ncbi:DUF359 domain-containing protein [Halobacteriales archaeon QS_1_68_44]|nr:MAG: DUF359 domain-containing protein [Halobacteriales archaeon QS_1_68_44]
MAEAVVELPDSLRGELKEPLGPVYTDAGDLLDDASGPVVAVGDIVTYHLLSAGYFPRVALVDGKTERERVDREVLDAIEGFDHRLEVENPLQGEEDLAALPAVLTAPDGASVVYGQPGEGMVLATVDGALRARCRELLERMDGDYERLADVLAG